MHFLRVYAPAEPITKKHDCLSDRDADCLVELSARTSMLQARRNRRSKSARNMNGSSNHGHKNPTGT